MLPITTKIFASTISSNLISVNTLPSQNGTLYYLDGDYVDYNMESTNIIPFRKWILYYNNLWKPETNEDINFIEYVKSNLLDFEVKKNNRGLKFYKNDKLWFAIIFNKLQIYSDASVYSILDQNDYEFFIKKFLLTHYN